MIKILILGGGFGGVRAALDLSRLLRNRGSSIPLESGEKKLKYLTEQDQVEITLLDKNSYHLFTPSLYEVASAYGVAKDPFSIKLKKTISIPYQNIFGGKKIKFIQAEISKINLEHNLVATGGGETLHFDYLVLALGSQASDFGINGVREYACQFKNIEDALLVNQKIEEITRKMAENKQQTPMEILICGGGFTGVELSAEIAGCAKKIARKYQIGRVPHLNYLSVGRARIKLFEAGPKILPMISDKERMIISKRLTELGVAIMENSVIEEVGADFVKLKNSQKINGDLVIWTAGVKANEILKSVVDLPLTDRGKITVNEFMVVKNLENIFAVGDNIEFIDSVTQKPIPAQAYTAIDQGMIVATNIANKINGKKLKKYHPFFGVWISPVGGKFTVAHLWGGITIRGFAGWLVKGLVDLKYFISILSMPKALALFWRDFTLFRKND